MKHKLLPLPVGERAPQGSSIRFWHQYAFRARLDSLALWMGVALAAVGAWLGTHPVPLRVGVDGSGYHIGRTTLLPADPATYNGDVAVVMRREDGQVRAAAAGKLAGKRMQGLCVMVNGSDTEQCIFVVDGHSFHAQDRLRGGAWQRTYDDGVRVDIRVADPRNPPPVPLPVGRD